LHSKVKAQINTPDQAQSAESAAEAARLHTYLFNNGSLLFDDSVYSDAQSGCVDLDKFLYVLVIKCPSDLVTVLVDTIQKRLVTTTTTTTTTTMNNSDAEDEFKEVDFIARRLIRAVVRLFVILCIETPAASLAASLSIGGAPTVTSLTPAAGRDGKSLFYHDLTDPCF
jgi:hypothetical protein